MFECLLVQSNVCLLEYLLEMLPASTCGFGAWDWFRTILGFGGLAVCWFVGFGFSGGCLLVLCFFHQLGKNVDSLSLMFLERQENHQKSFEVCHVGFQEFLRSWTN